nr:MAG TPA: hypothetical protein [Caudoviricetes sp.]
MKRHIQKIKMIKTLLLVGAITWILFLLYCRAAGPLDIVWK